MAFIPECFGEVGYLMFTFLVVDTALDRLPIIPNGEETLEFTVSRLTFAGQSQPWDVELHLQ